MLPLIPLMIAMTILISASLFLAAPSGTGQATPVLVDDMLRHHQAISRAVDDLVPKVGRPISVAVDNLVPEVGRPIDGSPDLGPFRSLVVWQSAIVREVDSTGKGVATWVVTWPAEWQDDRSRQKADLAAIPARLRAAGYRNSRFGAWSVPDTPHARPTGTLDGLLLEGVTIPRGAPVIANLVSSAPPS